MKFPNDQAYSVARLRSLYATLLSNIAPGNESSYPLLDDDDSKGDMPRQYSVRNFRRSSSFDGASDNDSDGTNDGCDMVTFDSDSYNFKGLTVYGEHAWRTLSATVSIEKEGLKGGAVAMRNDEAVLALVKARKVECRVIELIRKIGEVVVYGEQRSRQRQSMPGRRPPRNQGHDPVFEYFCDKNILSLLVDIIKAKPFFDLDQFECNSTSVTVSPPSTPLTGVVWTALVKAQVLQTISILISNVQDQRSLYYLLSNNYINEIISSLVPLHQWTAPALDEILPVYVSFLKSLALRLATENHLFPFFCDRSGSSSSLPAFPLFFAAVEVVSSPLNCVQSFVHTTALNIILNICQLSYPDIISVVGESYTEQQLLLSYLCQELSHRYESIRSLLIGPRVDAKRHADLITELTSLEDQLHFINDLLWCAVRSLNVRLCEYIMRWIVHDILLKNLDEYIDPFLKMDLKDSNGKAKHIGKEESFVQTSILFLAHMFMVMDYTPLMKMITVALLHPYHPTSKVIETMIDDGKDYIFTPMLNDVAQDNFEVDDKHIIIDGSGDSKEEKCDDNDRHSRKNEARYTCAGSSPKILVGRNPYRSSILRLLNTGDERFTLPAILLESIMTSKCIDFDTLQMMHIIPDYSTNLSFGSKDESQSAGEKQSEDQNYQSPFESAIGQFIHLFPNTSSSKLGSTALDCGISLALCYIDYLIQCLTEQGSNLENFESRFTEAHIVKGIKQCLTRFAAECQRLKTIAGVGDLFTQLVEMEISDRYAQQTIDGRAHFICDLRKVNATSFKINPDALVLKSQDVSRNEVEDARFAIRLVLYLNQICDAFQDVQNKVRCAADSFSSGPLARLDKDSLKLQKKFPATEDLLLMGGLNESPIVGTDIDTRGRTFFYFFPCLDKSDESLKSIKSALHSGASTTEKGMRRQMADKMIIHASKRRQMMIVIDRTQIIILKPSLREGINRGKILCSTPVRNIVATCCDDVWLHIAIRNVEDIGVLVCKGNMALRFDSGATAQIVKECVEKCRVDHNRSTLHQIDDLLQSMMAKG